MKKLCEFKYCKNSMSIDSPDFCPKHNRWNIIKKFKNGMNKSEIARQIGTSRQYVDQVIRFTII
jgi:hypothetical protein